MKTISEKLRAKLLRDLRKLRAELRELKANPPPRRDPLEAFRQALRDDLEEQHPEQDKAQANPS